MEQRTGVSGIRVGVGGRTLWNSVSLHRLNLSICLRKVFCRSGSWSHLVRRGLGLGSESGLGSGLGLGLESGVGSGLGLGLESGLGLALALGVGRRRVASPPAEHEHGRCQGDIVGI